MRRAMCGGVRSHHAAAQFTPPLLLPRDLQRGVSSDAASACRDGETVETSTTFRYDARSLH